MHTRPLPVHLQSSGVLFIERTPTSLDPASRAKGLSLPTMTMDEIHEWHGYSSTDSLLPLCRYCDPRWEDRDATALDSDFDLNPPVDSAVAINYELAGRNDAMHSFRDLRSPSKARKRHRERNEKYWSFRAVKAGPLGKAHHMSNQPSGTWYTTLLPDAPRATMTKQQLYRDAQTYPRPPKLHRSKRWEKTPSGADNRHSGLKHARQRHDDLLDEALGDTKFLITGDFAGIDFSTKIYGVMREFGATAHAEGVLGDEGCECACYLCHRECHEQQRREREEAQFDWEHGQDEVAVKEEEWEFLSRASTISAQSADCRDEADLDEVGEGEESEWLLLRRPEDTPRPRTQTPFAIPQRFDGEGWLAYTDAHFYSDLETDRCRACVAEYLTSCRLACYTEARLSDVAFLRGMPVEFTDWTYWTGVPFRQLLPLLVEHESIMQQYGEVEPADGFEIIQAARGLPAEDYYQLMGLTWWDGPDENLWVVDVGFETFD